MQHILSLCLSLLLKKQMILKINSYAVWMFTFGLWKLLFCISHSSEAPSPQLSKFSPNLEMHDGGHLNMVTKHLSAYWNITSYLCVVHVKTAAPSPPYDITVLESVRDSMALGWKQPKVTGGTEITGYYVNYREVIGGVPGKWMEANIKAISERAYRVRGQLLLLLGVQTIFPKDILKIKMNYDSVRRLLFRGFYIHGTCFCCVFSCKHTLSILRITLNYLFYFL